MKINLLSLTVLVGSLFTSYAHVHAASLMFEIQGIKNDAGKIYLSLFKGKENYQNDKAQAWQIIKPQAGTSKVVFDNLTPGEYAVKYFHDENDDRKLEMNLFGSPVEGYGFSNDAKPSYGPARYEDMKVEITEQSSQVITTSSVIYN